MIQHDKVRPALRDALTESLFQLIGLLSGLTVILGGLGAFLGWTAQSAYLMTFGIDPSWSSTNFVQLVETGWVEILAAGVLIVFCTVSRAAVTRVTTALATETRMLSYAMISFGAIAAILVGLRIAAHVLPGDLVSGVMFTESLPSRVLLFAVWWLMVVVGSQPSKAWPNQADGSIRSVVSTVFSLTTPVIIVTLLLGLYVLTNVATTRGGYYGTRDKSELRTTLPLVTIASKTPLGIASEQLLTDSVSSTVLYRYADLRLVVHIGDYVFLFRPSETEQTTGAVKTYIVPSRNIESLQMQQWFWPPPTPTPNGSATLTP